MKKIGYMSRGAGSRSAGRKKIIAIITLLFAIPSLAIAHERQVFGINGADFIFVVGSLNEPVAVDDKTGVELQVKASDPTDPTNTSAPGVKPVTGLESTLKVEVKAGDKSMTQDLSPSWGEPGAYHTTFYPTVQTTYSYRFFGKVNGTDVDLTFTCNPSGHVVSPSGTETVAISEKVSRKFKAGSFGCPKAKSELGFPEPASTIVDLKKDAGNNPVHPLAVVAFIFSIIALGHKRRSA